VGREGGEMSEGQRIPLAEARRLAVHVVELLCLYCERIEVAGSIRREKIDVGDIEIVCIPKLFTSYNLLGEALTRRDQGSLTAHLILGGYQFSKNGDHFKQFSIGPCKCDLFITTPECWGMIYTIRTGSAEFSHRLVTPRSQGGLMPSYMQAEGGRLKLRTSKKLLDTPEERDVFKVMGIDWIEPRMR